MQLAPTETTVATNGPEGVVILPEHPDHQRMYLNHADAIRLHKELGDILGRVLTLPPNRPRQPDPDALVLAIIDTHRHIENIITIRNGYTNEATSQAAVRLDRLIETLTATITPTTKRE